MDIKNQNLHLRDIFRILRKRRSVLVGFFVTFFSIVLLFTFTSTPYYEGSTKIMVEKAEGEDLTGGRYVSRATDPEFYGTQFQLIKSRAVARRVVQTLGLDKNPEAFFGKQAGRQSPLEIIVPKIKGMISGIVNLFSKEKTVDDKKQDELSPGEIIAAQISEKIQVRPVEGSRIVNISFLSPNPQLAALVANTTADAYIETILEMKLNSTRTRLEWMTQKAEAEAEKLQKSEQALQEYMKTNNLVTIEDRMTMTPEQLTEINLQLLRAEARRKELESLYGKVKSVGKNYGIAQNITAVASQPALQAIRAQIVETEKSLMELGNKYGPKHPIMVKAQGDLQLLERKRDQEIERIIESIKVEYELAEANERSLQEKLVNSKTEAIVLNEKFIQYGHLKRVVDTNRTLYDALLLKMKEQSITEENQPVNLWLVENAKVPRKPAKPWVAANLLIGLVVGALGGVAFVFFMEYLDNTIKDPEDVERAFGLPVIGVVQRWKKKSEDLENIVIKEPLSQLAESYRGIRTAIQLSFPDNPPKRILLSSAVQGEGKTTTAVNLAMITAQSNQRVLLIEGDLRRPRLHRIFKLNNAKGLSNYLAGEVDGPIMQKGPLPRMAIIPAGPIPPNPAELLVSSRMQTLLEAAARDFDFIICDAPPLLPVADTRILARLFDGVILICNAGKTTFDMAERSVKMVHDLRARLLGLVVNRHDIAKSGYYHQSYYDYYETPKSSPEVSKG
ncbi:MAG: polysaccharide biosynthesis tyrosine autokinase [Syntrophotaleaceae bacterium]